MKRAAITGASGFVGGALAAELKAAGYEVTALVRPTSDRSYLEKLGVRFVEGGLSDSAALSKLVQDADVVHHVAAVVRARDLQEFDRSNVEGTRAVLEACAARPGGAPPVVLVSSLAAAGPSVDGVPLTESAIPHPINAYGRSKRAQELLADEFRGRVPVVVVRPPVVYGPRDKAVLLMFRTAALRLCPRLAGGTEKTCMIHVEDLARALRLAGERGAAGSTYFVTDGEIHNTLEISRTMARILERRALTLPIPIALVGIIARIAEALTPRGVTPVLNEEKVLDLTQRYWICSDARARQDLGYVSQWRLEPGLRQTASWYRAQGWLS